MLRSHSVALEAHRGCAAPVSLKQHTAMVRSTEGEKNAAAEVCILFWHPLKENCHGKKCSPQAFQKDCCCIWWLFCRGLLTLKSHGLEWSSSFPPFLSSLHVEALVFFFLKSHVLAASHCILSHVTVMQCAALLSICFHQPASWRRMEVSHVNK